MLEMVFAKADDGLSAYYDERLVPEELQPLGDRLRRQLDADTTAIGTILGRQELLETQPWIRQSIQLRNIYTDPLNYLQAELLQRNRAETRDFLDRAIMVTIAGIAAGMRNTG
jgi:phosphoenolpyruvate carboxylase